MKEDLKTKNGRQLQTKILKTTLKKIKNKNGRQPKKKERWKTTSSTIKKIKLNWL
jgi:hypothetical protein